MHDYEAISTWHEDAFQFDSMIIINYTVLNMYVTVVHVANKSNLHISDIKSTWIQ